MAHVNVALVGLARRAKIAPVPEIVMPHEVAVALKILSANVTLGSLEKIVF